MTVPHPRQPRACASLRFNNLFQRALRIPHTRRRFHPPARHNTIIATARPIAVRDITHQIPALPHLVAAHAARGPRSAVSAVDVSIGGTVSPAPPSAPSRTISAQTASCDTAAIRRYDTACLLYTSDAADER